MAQIRSEFGAISVPVAIFLVPGPPLLAVALLPAAGRAYSRSQTTCIRATAPLLKDVALA